MAASAPQLTSLPAMRLVGVTSTISLSAMGEQISSLFASVADKLVIGTALPGDAVAVYEAGEAGMSTFVGFVYDGEAPADLETRELPAVERALTAVHTGGLESIQESWSAIHEAVAAQGLTATGPAREVYAGESPEAGTTLQQPVR